GFRRMRCGFRSSGAVSAKPVVGGYFHTSGATFPLSEAVRRWQEADTALIANSLPVCRSLKVLACRALIPDFGTFFTTVQRKHCTQFRGFRIMLHQSIQRRNFEPTP